MRRRYRRPRRHHRVDTAATDQLDRADRRLPVQHDAPHVLERRIAARPEDRVRHRPHPGAEESHRRSQSEHHETDRRLVPAMRQDHGFELQKNRVQ